ALESTAPVEVLLSFSHPVLPRAQDLDAERQRLGTEDAPAPVPAVVEGAVEQRSLEVIDRLSFGALPLAARYLRDVAVVHGHLFVPHHAALAVPQGHVRPAAPRVELAGPRA